MEDEARKMELKLELLRKTLDSGPELSSSAKSNGGAAGASGDSGGRWRSGTAKKPLRNGYVKDVLEKPRASGKAKARDTPADSTQGSRGGSGCATPTREASEPLAQGSFAGALGSPSPRQPSGAPPPPNAGGRAAANLQAAMSMQNRESKEVEDFLSSLGLDRYVGLFMEHGFDCMEVVTEMQECHMREIGMATGHALKLRKRLTELNPAPTSPAPAAPAPAAPAAATTAQSSMNSAGQTQKRVSFGGAELQTVTTEGGSGSLLDGPAFDEEESKASFQEAIRAWREGRNVDSSSKAVANESTPKAVGSFWSKLGDDEVNLERCSTPVTSPKASETQHDPAPGDVKICCYQCYKQYFAKYTIERESPLPDRSIQRFCSEACADRWTTSMEAKAEELRKRQEKLVKLEEMEKAFELERAANRAAAAAAAETNPAPEPATAA